MDDMEQGTVTDEINSTPAGDTDIYERVEEDTIASPTSADDMDVISETPSAGASKSATNILSNSGHQQSPPIEPLPSIGSVTGIKGLSGPSGVMGKTSVRPNVIQLPGNMLGKGPVPPQSSTLHNGAAPLHAPTPRIMSPTYQSNPGYGPVMTSYPPTSGNGPNSGGVTSLQPQSTTTTAATTAATTASLMTQQQQQQKMELHDAFAYLDKVKAEFSDQPDVYNRFLQIMREFKANAIDANGVIVRVVQLFKGHKALIQGFNAFLPRTHHIDPMVAETGILPPHLMQVAASMGISLNSQGIPISLSMASTPSVGATNTVTISNTAPSSTAGSLPPSYPISSWNTGSNEQQSSYYPSAAPSSSNVHIPQWRAPGPIIHPSPIAQAPPISTATTPAGPTGSNFTSTTVTGSTTPGKKSSAQFVRAISYVKKIKHRFVNEPETYKTFLAALHSYHKEQKTIFEVYMEVANLFADHPDLLEEFVLFLPENEATAITTRLSQANGATTAAVPRGHGRNEPISTTFTGTTGLIGRGSSGGVATAVTATTSGSNVSKRPLQQPLPPSKSSKRSRQATALSNRSAEESAFYERVKRYLGDKNAYAEFLKCLNLFCQDIIKIGDLVQLVSRFIGSNNELFGWFKRYIGYKDTTTGPIGSEGALWKSTDSVINGDLVNEHGELNLAACKKVGSYRIYPKAHFLSKSSHRTAIGHEVLNDSMVSCPVFNSEDSTFIASKKNAYEEALFKCEDERFEMDLLLENNAATIAAFEPLARKIEAMNPEERNNLTLGPNLGGTSAVIYKKAIKKIYGEKTEEVMAGLMKNPAVAVPVVLRRLKQKDEEWRRTQRDWNKIWRDIHLKNYYKALDHQGIEFKMNDRKSLSSRSLIQEIESIVAERKRMAERGDATAIATSASQHHLEFACSNIAGSVEDLSKLVKSFVKGGTVSLSKNDSKSVLKFLGSFLPSFYSLQTHHADNIDQQMATKRKDKRMADKLAESSAATTTTPAINDSASEDASSEGSMSDSEEGETTFSAKTNNNNNTGSSDLCPTSMSIILFANQNIYVLIRLLQMAMERLDKLCSVAKSANGSPFFTEKKNIVASFLDLQSQVDAGMEIGTANDFYATLLVLLKQLVAGSLDSSVFEERVRFMFGTAAYPIFTFDRVIQAIVKQVQLILSDAACEQLVRLFDSWNSCRGTMRLSEYSARMAVESTLPAKESIYRVEYNPKTNRLTIQLLDRLTSDVVSGGGTTSAESKWSSYVDNFVKLENNPQYLEKTKAKVFLKRCRIPQTAVTDAKDLMVQYNLECKIAINTYKLFYVENTEDYLYRYGVKGRRKISKRSLSEFNKWLQNHV